MLRVYGVVLILESLVPLLRGVHGEAVRDVLSKPQGFRPTEINVGARRDEPDTWVACELPLQ